MDQSKADGTAAAGRNPEDIEHLLDGMVNWTTAAGVLLALALVCAQVAAHLHPPPGAAAMHSRGNAVEPRV
ncbi:MAG TPA: hypothetical protein VHE37_08370 [Nevskiaceae bacterium]|nr:hypothetical protein [Nevskiaceae bacterium]